MNPLHSIMGLAGPPLWSGSDQDGLTLTSTGLARPVLCLPCLVGVRSEMARTTKAQVWNGALGALRKNRRALRRRGLRSEDLAFLELWLSMPRASLAALGRVRGYSRQAACQRAARLCDVGAVVRLGSRMLPNVRGLLRWCEAGCRERLAAMAERMRAAREKAQAGRKALETLLKSQNDKVCLSHSGTEEKKAENGGIGGAVRRFNCRTDAAVEAKWLAEMGLRGG